MSTKRHFKKKTLLKKHKKVNLTKKHNKSRLTKRRINKLSGGEKYSTDQINHFMSDIYPNLKTKDDFVKAENSLINYLKKNGQKTNKPVEFAKLYLSLVIKLKKEKIKQEEEQEEEKKQEEKNQEEEIKTINHIWFKKWPDHGVPITMDEFNTFITYLFNDMKSGGDTVIHCSAGVGRTGVVYVVLKLLSEGYTAYEYNSVIKEEALNELNTRIDTIINEERQKRNKFFVQAAVQYNFIYKYFAGKVMSNFEAKFTKLSQKECSYPNPRDIMNGKNRYSNIIPCEASRVKLDNVPYINASNMSPLTINGNIIQIIAAQCPKDVDTIKDFYQMLQDKDKKIKRIVMVTGLFEKREGKREEKCLDYFGSTLGNGKPIPNSNNRVVTLLKSNEIVDIRTLSYKEEVAPAGPEEAGPAAKTPASIPQMPLPEEAGPAAQTPASIPPRPPIPPMPLPEEAAEQLLMPEPQLYIANYDYTPEPKYINHLTFEQGNIIFIKYIRDDGWGIGSISGNKPHKYVPMNYMAEEPASKFRRNTTKAIIVKPKSKTNPLKKLEYPWDNFKYTAIADYTPSPKDSAYELTFKKGDNIYIKKIDDNWGLGSILKNGPYDKYVPLNLFEENTHQNIHNIHKNRLYDFLKTLINKKNQISLSFCDCKLILLYILNYNIINLFGLDFTYEKKIELFKKLKQKHISSYINNSNSSLLNYTIDILKRIYGDHNIDISPNIIRCSDIELDIYMIDKNYTYLFNANEITQILSIFKKAGDLLKPVIDYQSFILSKKPDSSNA